MNRKMKVIKEYFSYVYIRYVYAFGGVDTVVLEYSSDKISLHRSEHPSFDDAIDYLYDIAVRGGQPE